MVRSKGKPDVLWVYYRCTERTIVTFRWGHRSAIQENQYHLIKLQGAWPERCRRLCKIWSSRASERAHTSKIIFSGGSGAIKSQISVQYTYLRDWYLTCCVWQADSCSPHSLGGLLPRSRPICRFRSRNLGFFLDPQVVGRLSYHSRPPSGYSVAFLVCRARSIPGSVRKSVEAGAGGLSDIINRLEVYASLNRNPLVFTAHMNYCIPVHLIHRGRVVCCRCDVWVHADVRVYFTVCLKFDIGILNASTVCERCWA